MNSTQQASISLRDYQELAISQVYQHFESGLASVLLYAPTGAGKTIVAVKIIADYVLASKRVMFVVHRGKLVRQTVDKLYKHFGIEAGVIWGDYYKPDYSKAVQIAMLQTIRNRTLPEEIDLVILDEAHTGSYFKVWRDIMDKYSGGIWILSKTKFFGLSASPWRAKSNQGYCQFFQTIVQAPYPNQLIEMGHLCRARQFGFTDLIDESKLKIVDGEYTEKSMADVCTPALNSEIVKLYLEKDPDIRRKLIAFCATVKQAIDLAYQFYLVGVVAQCIVGDTPEKEREEIFEKFSSGEVQLISSVGVLCEGFDEPTVSSVLVCRPIKSRALWVQMSGRGLRTSNGKDDCWSELSSSEKLSYRSWKETDASESIKQHTIKLEEKEEETTANIQSIPIPQPTLKPQPELTQNASIDDDTPKKRFLTPSVGFGVQLTLFAETKWEKEMNDVVNPMRLQIGDMVANNNPSNKAYNQKGRIANTHHADRRLCQVYYESQNKYAFVRYVDLRRA